MAKRVSEIRAKEVLWEIGYNLYQFSQTLKPNVSTTASSSMKSPIYFPSFYFILFYFIIYSVAFLGRQKSLCTTNLTFFKSSASIRSIFLRFSFFFFFLRGMVQKRRGFSRWRRRSINTTQLFSNALLPTTTSLGLKLNLKIMNKIFYLF